MFETKKKKNLRLQKEAELKKERELETKMQIKSTLNKMKAQSMKLDSFKKDYIDKARKALTIGDQGAYNLSKSGLKICLSKQKFLDSMVMQFELTLQIADMNKIVGEFVNGMNNISEQIKNVTSNIDMTKAQAAYEKAIANNETQYEALNAFLATATDSIQTLDSVNSNISDDEINKLITRQAVDNESEIDDEIDRKINNLESEISKDIKETI